MTFQCIIFDLDDTLYLEREFVRSGFWAVARWAEDRFAFDAAHTFRDLWQSFLNGVRGDNFNRWLRRWELSQRLVPEMISCYRLHDPQITPFSEVPALLARLRSTARLGLVSDGDWHVQQGKIAALRLAPCLDAIVYSDQLGENAWKPSPRGLQVALDQLSASAQHAVYVADNPRKDFLAARAAGMRSIRLRQPMGLYFDLEAESADHAADFEFRDHTTLGEFLVSGTSSTGQDVTAAHVGMESDE